MEWIDIIYTALLSLSMIYGIMKGIHNQLIHLFILIIKIALILLVIAFISDYAHLLYDFLTLKALGLIHTGLSQWAHSSVTLRFIINALILLGLYSIFTLLIQRIIKDINPKPNFLDRFLGAFLGLLRGVFIILTLNLILNFYTAHNRPLWSNSRYQDLMNPTLSFIETKIHFYQTLTHPTHEQPTTTP